MKIILFLLLLIPSFVFSECTDDQFSASISVEVVKELEADGYHENHGPMLEVTISAPSDVLNVPINAMELTRGEVAEFWIPLAFSIENGTAKAWLTGYEEALLGFEVAVYYQSASCILYTQKLI